MRDLMFALMLVSSAGLGACAVKTDVPVSTIALPTAGSSSSQSLTPMEQQWWGQFDDDVLTGLVEDALAANREIQSAVSRFEAARELAGVSRLTQLPWGGVSAGVARRHLSEREAFGLTIPGRTANFIDAGATLRWEADLFGRLRGSARAAAADAAALRMDAHGVQVAIAAQVASAYFDFRGAQQEHAVLTAMREETRALAGRTNVLVDTGRLARLDLLQVQQVEESLTGDLAAVEHARERARLRLATLTGRTPDEVHIADASWRPLRAVRVSLDAAGDLVRQRPDVAAAELRVLAAATRAGVARRELFPRIEFTGSVGLIAGSLGQLGAASAGSWLVAPRVVWTVLDWPRLRRQMRAAGALTEAAFAEYEQAVLAALEDVRVAMDGYGAVTERVRSAERRADTAARAASIVTVQHREGMADALARAVANRAALEGVLVASRTVTEHRQAVVSVYRALGGGWQ